VSYFITLEGIDGTGKTTQCKMLSEYLTERGIKNILTREPGASFIGPQIREIVLHNHDICDEARLMLFMADRAEHMSKVVIPALSDGVVVVCDRYFDSTIAYQGYGQGMNISLLKLAHQLIPHRMPDITFLLDAEVSDVSMRYGSDQFELDTELMNRARFGFIAEMNKSSNPSRWRYINAKQSIEDIQHTIRCQAGEFFRYAEVKRSEANR
jgi:dTMP kinase